MLIQTILGLIIITLSFAPAVLSQSLDSPQQAQDQEERLKEDYFFQLEKFREAKSQYTLTRAQASKLGTLKSGNEFIESAKALMLARTQVLETYLIALKNSLDSTQGIDIADKQVTLDLIDHSQNLIITHRQVVSNLTDRVEISTEANRFESQDLAIFLEASYRSLSLISIGKLQNSYDQITVAGKQFEEDIIAKQEDQAKKVSQERGIKEISSQLQVASQSLSLARSAYREMDVRKSEQKDYNPRNTYNLIVKNISPSYTALQKSIDFLIELEKTK